MILSTLNKFQESLLRNVYPETETANYEPENSRLLSDGPPLNSMMNSLLSDQVLLTV